MQEITEMVNTQHGKNWKTQTVSTFLARLVKKDYLKMYRKGRCFYYQPLVDKEEYKDDVLLDYVQFWNDGNMCAFVCGLFEKKDLLSELECTHKLRNKHLVDSGLVAVAELFHVNKC